VSLRRDMGEVAQGVTSSMVSLHGDQRCVGSGSRVRSNRDLPIDELSTGEPLSQAMHARCGAAGRGARAKVSPLLLDSHLSPSFDGPRGKPPW